MKTIILLNSPAVLLVGFCELLAPIFCFFSPAFPFCELVISPRFFFSDMFDFTKEIAFQRMLMFHLKFYDQVI